MPTCWHAADVSAGAIGTAQQPIRVFGLSRVAENATAHGRESHLPKNPGYQELRLIPRERRISGLRTTRQPSFSNRLLLFADLFRSSRV